jgi:hypothetical protein
VAQDGVAGQGANSSPVREVRKPTTSPALTWIHLDGCRGGEGAVPAGFWARKPATLVLLAAHDVGGSAWERPG